MSPCLLILFAILAQGGIAPRGSALPQILLPTARAELSQTPTSSATPKENLQDDVVRVTTTLVTVPMSVIDRHGKYILDLSPENFHIYEDGVEQEIANFDSTEKAFNIALLLDISDSMRFRIGDIQSAAMLFVNQLRREDRVMVIAFDSQIRILLEPTTNHDLARDAISRTSLGGGTRVYDALNFVLNQRFKNIRGRKAVILFTDGVDSGSFQSNLHDNERDAEESDVLIYPIHYSTSKDSSEPLGAGPSTSGGSVIVPQGSGANRVDIVRADSYLHALAQKTGARFYHADDVPDLARSFSRIAQELRQQYSLSYYPKAPSQPGQRRQIKVRVKGTGMSVHARSSYIVGALDKRN